MAAGLGYKEFNTGDVLTAADANGYLASQVVMVFASAAARTSAIASPQEGMISYLKDTNSTEYYSGSAWVAIGGSSSPLTTKGDLYTYSTTNARLGVGTNGQVLTADSAEATGLKWATPAGGGGMTLLNSGSTNLAGLSGTVTFSSLSGSYKNLFINIYGANPSSSTAELIVRFNSDSTSGNYPHMEYACNFGATNPAFFTDNIGGIMLNAFGRSYLEQNANNFWNLQIPNYTRTGHRIVNIGDIQQLGTPTRMASGIAGYRGTAAITSLNVVLTAGSWTTGTIEIYGVN